MKRGVQKTTYLKKVLVLMTIDNVDISQTGQLQEAQATAWKITLSLSEDGDKAISSNRVSRNLNNHCLSNLNGIVRKYNRRSTNIFLR